MFGLHLMCRAQLSSSPTTTTTNIQMTTYYTRSPPPLQHPVPTHPAFIPEPPSTPGPGPASPQGYQRYQQPAPHHIPDFAAWGMNDTTAQFGMQLGQSAVAAGQEYVQKNVRHLLLSPTPH